MVVILNSFHAADYVVFSISLAVSIFIGIFFALRGGKQKTQGEYLLGDRKMSILPVAVSIQVSYMSAILIIGTPAEMYTQGVQYFIVTLGICIGVILSTLLVMPLVYPLKTTSIFEYLELRFNSVTVRLIGTLLTLFAQVCYMGVASFAPSTALEAVTGFPVWASVVLINGLTTIYTTIGGIKGVIWTDVFQSLVMLVGLLSVLVQACLKVGGLDKVWNISDEYGRLNFLNFDPDPTERHSFWSLVVGASIFWMGAYSVYQTSFQRYSSLPTLKKARIAMLLNMPGAIFFYALACLGGLAVFSYYVTEDCDVLAKGLVDNPNQIVPYFVMETLAYPAIPGLFLSSLFAGALSSISSALNALAALMWEDVFKRYFESRWSESEKMVFTKSVVVLCGCLSTMVGIIVQNLEGTVVQLVFGFLGTANGPMLGMFLLGGVFPWANAAGAAIGGVVSFCVSLWFVVGAYETGLTRDRFMSPNGTCWQYLKDDESTITTTMSTMMTNVTEMMTNVTTGSPGPGQTIADDVSGIEKMYTVSYMWYSAIGMATCVIIGLIVSFITGANSIDDVPTKYQIPLASRLLCCFPPSWKRTLNCKRNFDDADDEDNNEHEVKEFDKQQLSTEDHSENGYANTDLIGDHELSSTKTDPEFINVKF